MDASRASEASDDDDRRDGDADDGVDATGDVSGVGWSAASGVASQALRGGDVVGPSSGQAAVGPAGHACARMAALPEAAHDGPTRAGGRKHAAHSPLGNGRARMRRRAPSLQAAALRAMVYVGLLSRTGLCTQRDLPYGSNRLDALRALAAVRH